MKPFVTFALALAILGGIKDLRDFVPKDASDAIGGPLGILLRIGTFILAIVLLWTIS